ncbi:Mannose-6-phosphate isomerase [Heyndrickxia coagulans]|uniref:Mannose-6-phosphate isomerase n=2 Tax=Heyndrickxia coagulans TaxID=1398 RepID=A0A133KZX0_HEYCO|nr:Mannose-6-phosphate isomerase [Heyndrickxia coagulans]
MEGFLMKIILLSGGSGKRLWPLSNDSRSKQFLKVLEDKNSQLQSMVQRVWNQLETVGLAESTIIATSKSQVDMIRNQLDYQNCIVIEPSRRDTFPAIALASSFLNNIQSTNPNEVVVVLPVDSYVDDRFFIRIKDLETVLKQSHADLALIGVEPTYPSSKYGHIIYTKDNNSEEYFKVQQFIEKPSEKIAKELMEQGALWNCGVFAFKLGYILSILKEKGFSTDYYTLLDQYGDLPKISFDYEVVEKTNNIVVLPYKGCWKDLGTWNTLTEEMGTNQIGKGVISKDSSNTHLINELDIPVTILGVSNAIIAVSPDGILVSDKEKSPGIKEFVSGFIDRPMYEERRWGSYRVLDFVRYDENQEVLTKKIRIKAGSNLSYQYHLARKETWTIVKGKGICALNGSLKLVNAGDVLQVDVGDKHALKAITQLEIIEVQSGSELIEEDIVRLYTDWNKIESVCNKMVLN